MDDGIEGGIAIAMHNAVVHAGDWELRVRAGPMLRSAETRSLCASWFAPRRPWCVAGPGPPADCPCGALDLCGVAAHVPEACLLYTSDAADE